MIKKLLKKVPLFFLFLIVIFSVNRLFSSPQDRKNSTDLKSGQITRIEWSEDENFLKYSNTGNFYKFNLNNQEISLTAKDTSKQSESIKERIRRFRRKRKNKDPRIKYPSRGRQFTVEKSPDGKWYSICSNWNVELEKIENGKRISVTKEGNLKYRYGTANWVYGEELDVKHGMWWTPDSKKLIYYVFDERPVKDFYLIGDLTKINTKSLVEGYTKAGAPNPVVSLEIYNIDTKSKISVDCGEGEYYIYNMRFSPGGEHFLFNRTDRHHRRLDLISLNTETGDTEIIVTETQDTWQDNYPYMKFLSSSNHFIWETEKSMWRHYELRDINGSLICQLTNGDYPDSGILKIDEENNWLYYKASSDQNYPLRSHIHRVHLDGTNQQKITSLPYNHTKTNFSPDGKWFTVQYENTNTPPSTALYRTDGTQVKILAQGPKLDNPRTELFSYKAGDGETDLYGILHKPENFDPQKIYPLIVSVYGGPESRSVNNTFRNGHNYNDNGYLVAQFDNRGTAGRGKKFKAAVYGKLGDVDIQDQALGVKFLRKRPYIDNEHVGIIGHSYGGFMAAIGIVKYPDVFTAAVDRAGPTDWRNYDSIYTERYMNLPQDNPKGYKNSTVMNYVDNFKGHLLIMHGLVDDNVHPTNAWQLIDALDKAGKKYESRFFPRGTHGFQGTDTQMEFFKKYLKK